MWRSAPAGQVFCHFFCKINIEKKIETYDAPQTSSTFEDFIEKCLFSSCLVEVPNIIELTG